MVNTANKLSVVVLSYNTINITTHCIESLYEYSPITRGLEIVVVDNASCDGSADFIHGRFPDIKLIRNSTNRGFAAGCNQGIRSSMGDFILLLNSDAALIDQSLDILIDFMGRNPDVGICGGLMLSDDGTPQPSCHIFPSYTNLLFSKNWLLNPLSFFKKRFEKYREIPARNTDVDAVSGGFFLIRREALSNIGLMDERFFFYVEDIDISRRIKKAGWRVVIIPKAKVYHVGGASAKLRPSRTYAWHHISLFKYFMKYYPYLLPLNLLLGLGLSFHLLLSFLVGFFKKLGRKSC